MADAESVNGIITGTHVLGQDTLIITDGSAEGIEEGVTEEDILQQALEEASESLAQDTEGYTADDDTVAEQLVQSVAGGEFETTETVDDATLDGATYAIVGGDNLTLDPNSTVFISENTDSNNSNTSVLSTTLPHTPQPQGLSVRLVPANEGSGAPLGSSLNPIRIIQQGNQYTPVQQLTTEQLQQIMQVVQQQQVAKDTSTSGQSILYNPQTNTKIVYRVIYPSELHKSGAISIKQSQGQQTVVVSHIPKRTYKKKSKEEEDKYEGPELSKEEKEERKKHRPRTRSGRISKPPKHMVKDYKHIHVLDFDEEKGDASDGGYSDFKYSEDEGEKDEDDFNYVHPGIGVNKPKNWKCTTCHRGYIGRGGLGRHYRLFPDHGSINNHPEEATGTNNFTQNGFSNTPGNLSEDSNTQDSTSSTPPKSVGRPPLNRRGGYRGRHHHLRRDNPIRRKNKLREIIKDCDDEDLMEVVLPRLARVITLWEFLLMKVERGSPLRPRVDEVYKEFEHLSKEVKKMCSDYLIPTTDTDNNSNTKNKVKVQNSGLAEVLGLDLGTYEVKEVTVAEPASSSFQYAVLTPDPSAITVIPGGQSVKRTVAFVSHDQTVTQSPSKKPRTTVSVVGRDSSRTSFTNRLGSASIGQIESKPSVSQIIHIVQPSQPVTVQSGTVSNPVVVQQIVSGTNSSHPVKSSNQMAASSSLGGSDTVSIVTNNSVVGNNTAATVANQGVKISLLPVSLQNYTPGISGENLVVQTNAVTSLNDISSSTVVQTVTNGIASISGIENDMSDVITVVDDMANSKVDSATNDRIITSSQTVKPSIIQVHPSDIAASYNPVSSQTNNFAVINSTKPSTGAVSLLSNSNQSLLNSVTVDGISPEGDQTADGQLVGMEIEQPQTEMIQLVENQASPDQIEGIQFSSDQVTANIFQTADGIIIIQNPDGSTVQLQGGDGEPIPLETVQALLAMDDGQLLQTAAAEAEGLG